MCLKTKISVFSLLGIFWGANSLFGGSYVFDVQQPQTAYGEDVVATYNDSHEITSMEVTLPVGEDVRFSGDAMRFAAGAIISVPHVNGGGRLIFANDVVAAGVLTMTNAARCATYTGAANGIPAASTGNTCLVAPGVRLRDVEIVGVRSAGESVGVSQAVLCFPRWTSEGYEVQAQVVNSGSSYNKCAKLRLNDTDEGIVAAIVYARNLQTKQAGIDFDLPGTYGIYSIGTSYGISEIAFRDLRKPCVRFEGALTAPGISPYGTEVVLAGAALDDWASDLGGEDGKITFEGPAIGPEETNGNFTTPVNEVPARSFEDAPWSLLVANQKLEGMSVLSAKMGGSSILGTNESAKPHVASVVCFTNDGQNASFWVQYKSSSLKSIKVHVRQTADGNLEWCERETYYLSSAVMGENSQDLAIETFIQQLKDEGRYDDLIKAGTNGGINSNPNGNNAAAGLYTSGYAATEVSFAFPRIPQTKTVTLKNNTSMKNGEITASGKVAVVSGTASAKYSIPRDARVTISDGALFRVAYRGGDTTGYNDSRTDFRIHGGYLQVLNDWSLFHGTDQKILLDGSLLELGPLGGADTCASVAYCPNMTLRNGARIVGAVPYVMGETVQQTCFSVDGDTPSAIESYLAVQGSTVGSVTPDLVFDVADCGLALTKGFVDCAETRAPVRIIKRGVGTCAYGAYDGRFSTGALGTTTPTTLVVEDGTWELAGSGSANAGLTYELAGGTLAAAPNTVNEAPALAVTADGGLAVGDGAELAFADSHASAWAPDAKIVIDADLTRASVRFGTSAAGLTRAQLKQLVPPPEADDGCHRFVLDANGYLRWTAKPGFVVNIR